jgi:hypothetical protein
MIKRKWKNEWIKRTRNSKKKQIRRY